MKLTIATTTTPMALAVLLVLLAAQLLSVATGSCTEDPDYEFKNRNGKMKSLCDWLNKQKQKKRQRICNAKGKKKDKYMKKFGTDVTKTCGITCGCIGFPTILPTDSPTPERSNSPTESPVQEEPKCPDPKDVGRGGCDFPGQLSGCPAGRQLVSGCRNDAPEVCNGPNPPPGCDLYTPVYCSYVQYCSCVAGPPFDCPEQPAGQEPKPCPGPKPIWECITFSAEQCTNPTSPKDENYENYGGDDLFKGLDNAKCNADNEIFYDPPL